jgi:hypothetical protein
MKLDNFKDFEIIGSSWMSAEYVQPENVTQVSEDEFSLKRGTFLVNKPINHSLFVDRYEYGEGLIYSDNSYYYLYT